MSHIKNASLASMIRSRLGSEDFKSFQKIKLSVVVCGNNILWNRQPLDPSFKLAATLRHLDSGVCNVMYEEYVDEVMTARSHLKNGNY